MKKAKLKQTKQKKETIQTQDTMSGKSVMITLLSIIVIFSAFYFLTDFLISRRTKPSSNSNINSNSNVISFTEMFKQTDDEYYVLAIIGEEEETIYERYANSTGKKYYKIDMNDIMNSAHISKETSIGDSVKDIKIADSTLFVVKDGKIKEHFTGKKDILDYLQKNLKVESSNSNS